MLYLLHPKVGESVVCKLACYACCDESWVPTVIPLLLYAGWRPADRLIAYFAGNGPE